MAVNRTNLAYELTNVTNTFDTPPYRSVLPAAVIVTSNGVDYAPQPVSGPPQSFNAGFGG